MSIKDIDLDIENYSIERSSLYLNLKMNIL